jgi:sodium-dependent phosphate cotransporter
MRARLDRTIRWLQLFILLYLFFFSISLLSASLKLFGQDAVTELLSIVSNPFVGLFVGILATSVVQSSSSVTSITVGLVAGGGLDVSQAIPIIMGSNMGTSVTNALVAAMQLNKPEEFQRAFAAAVVDDFFEICSILVLFPLQLYFNLLGASAAFLSKQFTHFGGLSSFNPLKAVIDPVVELTTQWVTGSGLLALIIALALLFFSMRYLVSTLKQLFIRGIEKFFDRTLFKTAARAMLLGLLATALIQSSSITTSLTVPLAGAGLITLQQVFPYALGANVGTTLTAMLAALATGEEAALTVAFAHFLYNIFGIAIIWPIRQVPLGLAGHLARYSGRSRLVPLGYIAFVFFAIPMALIYFMR